MTLYPFAALAGDAAPLYLEPTSPTQSAMDFDFDADGMLEYAVIGDGLRDAGAGSGSAYDSFMDATDPTLAPSLTVRGSPVNHTSLA